MGCRANANANADGQKAAGKSGPDLYTFSFSIMIGLLIVALVCNELIEPVDDKWHEPSDDRTTKVQESTP